MARETPQALQAFEDYWAMGDGRSLQKLVSLYRARSVSGEDVPTKRLPTSVKWSSETRTGECDTSLTRRHRAVWRRAMWTNWT